MPFWYFLRVPILGPEVNHQSNAVDVRKYLIRGGKFFDSGTPIIEVENYWAVMQLRAVGRGTFRKSFFDHHESVRIGDPIGIVAADGDDQIYDRDNLSVKILEVKRQRLSP
jgi:pyruvate/2-oxoglutarate dehydrogenase complex dihydrolipoamide acyltransferase (E2) component